MAKGKLPNGVHAVRCVRRDGVAFHFYAWRGDPKFWTDTHHYPADPAFHIAYAVAIKLPKPATYMAPDMVDDFLSSPHMPKGEQTRQDYRKWALRFAQAFGDDPVAIFEEPGSRAEINEWRKQWAHSPKQYDYAGTVVTRVLNWAWKDAGKIR